MGYFPGKTARVFDYRLRLCRYYPAQNRLGLGREGARPGPGQKRGYFPSLLTALHMQAALIGGGVDESARCHYPGQRVRLGHTIGIYAAGGEDNRLRAQVFQQFLTA
jgi:hypothetical protein